MFSISLDDRSITFNFPSKAVLLKENSWTNINRQHARWKTTSEASEILLVDRTIRICFFSLHLVTMLMKKCETDGTYLFDVYMTQILKFSFQEGIIESLTQDSIFFLPQFAFSLLNRVAEAHWVQFQHAGLL